MSVILEEINMGDEFDVGSSSLSFEDCGSNAIMMPGKKTKKKKKNQNVVKEKPLSKSQKRKLKKLEEEKGRAIVLSTSFKVLEESKIPESAYPLLQSTQDIGKDQTRREKKVRHMHMAKAGMEVEHSDQPFKRARVDTDSETQSDLDETQLSDDNTEVEVPSNTPVISASSQRPAPCTDLVINGECRIPLHGKEILDRDRRASSEDDTRTFSSTTCLKSTGINDPKKKELNLVNCPLQGPSTTPCVVHVSRPIEVENTRKGLPIVMMEQEIMEAINENSSVIICGETGCGKTTQVPQFLYEAGFGSNKSVLRRGIIGVTQPRRVAVLSTAKRVAHELGLRLGKEIGFQVRHDKMIGESSSIKFMTDGILLREVQNQFLLNRYSVIILDEAHERSLNTDILIGMLSRVIRIRQEIYEEQRQLVLQGKLNSESVIPPLKLILMSATLRVEDFISGNRLFHTPPPVIEVPTRQYPVTAHFSRRTEVVDYIGQAYKKILSIHKRLPKGGILVFVTGQREVEYLCEKLRKASKQLLFRSSRHNAEDAVASVSEGKGGDDMEEINEAFEIHRNASGQATDRFSSWEEDDLDGSDEEKSEDYYDSGTESELEFDDVDDSFGHTSREGNGNVVDISGEEVSLDSLKAAFSALAGKPSLDTHSNDRKLVSDTAEKNPIIMQQSSVAMCVLPLYAMLSAAAQLRVFEDVKEEERLIVVATNVAETSLTIPGIRYVVDTGRQKVKSYNPSNGMELYEIQWISKASAAQRAGRAGRTGPGHCYRLYSSAVFQNNLPDFSAAEITKIPVEGVTLLLKSMGIDKVANFPFPTPPERSALLEANRCLETLEALDSKGKLTPLGKAMAHFPMSPRHSRMLLTVIQIMRKVKDYARANLVLGYAVAAAAALSMSNPFINQFEVKDSDTDGVDHDKKHAVGFVTEKVAEKEEKAKKKKLSEKAKISRSKFANPRSDPLTVAYALQCFELSERPEEFCNEYVLHLKTMDEMSKLRKQLLQLVFNRGIGSGLQQEFEWIHGNIEEVENAWRVFSDKQPLFQNEEDLLCEAICAGWADRIAKRVRRSASSDLGEGKTTAVRYQASAVKELVFLHRYSSLARTTPEYLVYSELLHTKRPYMHGATSVKSDWLIKYAKSLCSFSAPLTDPRPYYEPLTDQLLCWVAPTFGPHLWKLPLHPLPVDDNLQRMSVFAYALLEGHILPCLKPTRKFDTREVMAASPSLLLRPEASGQERVGNLINGLRTKAGPIYSCELLREAWKKNPKKLYGEILGWFQKGFHDQFDELWSRMHAEALLEPHQRFPKLVKGRKRDKMQSLSRGR